MLTYIYTYTYAVCNGLKSYEKKEIFILNLGQKNWFLSQENGTESASSLQLKREKNLSMPKVILK